jgi:hypothetical protein
VSTRTQRLARQIQAEKDISYTRALRLAREEIRAEHETAGQDQPPAEQDGDDR